ncbi:uncharacterized protein BO80DRAFT_423091 [Aspergillus ibericus CBS 121593]|uniref:Uncharacterized protein n=1 Tax=Aspergillus ibericus CBS 121593 TaxID=1448316 RepID=A0A395H7M6_9EURO|nr:hypothetical protein BO80DRAFT_423091 [Aspergillus ibericus CBS 121593]RAL03660.1 hypothetical protein BO80DRAFT_423091 [Aspergillus ibericus CBS 121593]
MVGDYCLHWEFPHLGHSRIYPVGSWRAQALGGQQRYKRGRQQTTGFKEMMTLFLSRHICLRVILISDDVSVLILLLSFALGRHVGRSGWWL